jgi:hypothetical protein
VVEPADRKGLIPLAELDSQLFCRLAAVHTIRGAGSTAPTTQHLTGVGIRGTPSVIHIISVVLSHQLCRGSIDPDQEIPGRIEGNETLGQSIIECPALTRISRRSHRLGC